jgi:hypothetical protein
LNYGDVSHLYATVYYALPSFGLYSVATVYDKEEGLYTAYVNGEYIGQDLVEGGYRAWSSSVRFGNVMYYIPGDRDNPFNGIIHEARVYNTAFTASQIQSQYYTGLNRLLAKGLMEEKEYRERLTLK